MGDAAEEKRRAAWGYEPNTPQCCNCAKYRKARVVPPHHPAFTARPLAGAPGRFFVGAAVTLLDLRPMLPT